MPRRRCRTRVSVCFLAAAAVALRTREEGLAVADVAWGGGVCVRLAVCTDACVAVCICALRGANVRATHSLPSHELRRYPLLRHRDRALVRAPEQCIMRLNGICSCRSTRRAPQSRAPLHRGALGPRVLKTRRSVPLQALSERDACRQPPLSC
ncbi:hypothetical protein JKP88DRAFT_44171 [Tribonema minus]|uniref:Uncharacterized protein n=1 Tax=Tribonema minus TaxID=303371 RepID=A0A836CGS9_9STRA|nr:hypothetical protein JKP88DRAFT_44171 [Tribonema minus]